MNKTLPLALAIPALLLVFTAHAADESNWYLGAQYSAQEVSSFPDRNHNTVGVIAGYQYNKFLALETRFNTGTSGFSSRFYLNRLSDFMYKEDIDTQASLFIRASYPIFNSFSIYALAGVTKSKYEITTITTHTDLEGNTTVAYPHIIKLSDSGFSYGLGLNYQITEAFTVFIDYKALPEIAVFWGSSSSWKSASFGVNYSF